MSPDPSATNPPLAFNCPQCGLPLRPHAYRTEMDADGQPKKVYVFMCFTHGFFTFTDGTGLVEGL